MLQSSLEWSALSRLDREEIASSMAHSVEQQELYRLVSLSSTLPNRPWQLLQLSGTKLTTAMSKQVYILQPPDSWGTCKWWSGVFVTGSCKRLYSWLTHTACIMTYMCCHINCMATNTEYCTRESRLHYLYSVVQHMCCHINFVEGKSTALQRCTCVLWGEPFVWNTCSTCAVCFSVLAVTQ